MQLLVSSDYKVSNLQILYAEIGTQLSRESLSLSLTGVTWEWLELRHQNHLGQIVT